MAKRRRLTTPSLIALAGVLLVSTGGNIMMALRPASTTIDAYTISLGQGTDAASSIVLDTRRGRAFVPTWVRGATVGHISIVDTTTQTLWRTLSVSIPFATPAIDEQTGHLFAPVIAATGTVVEMLDSRTGNLLRTTRIDFDAGVAVDQQAGRVFVLRNGIAYCQNLPGCHNRDGSIGILDAASGQLLRRLAGPGQGDAAEIAVDGPALRLILARRDLVSFFDTISVLDTTSGRLVQRVSTPLTSRWRLPLVDAVIDRAFLAVDNVTDGSPLNTRADLYVLDTRSGTIVRRVALGPTLGYLAVDERMGRAFATTYGAMTPRTMRSPYGGVTTIKVLSGTGSVRVLDARTGVLLQTVPIGLATTGVAVDERRGRVFVASAGSVAAGPSGTSGIYAGPAR